MTNRHDRRADVATFEPPKGGMTGRQMRKAERARKRAALTKKGNDMSVHQFPDKKPLTEEERNSLDIIEAAAHAGHEAMRAFSRAVWWNEEHPTWGDTTAQARAEAFQSVVGIMNGELPAMGDGPLERLQQLFHVTALTMLRALGVTPASFDMKVLASGKTKEELQSFISQGGAPADLIPGQP